MKPPSLKKYGHGGAVPRLSGLGLGALAGIVFGSVYILILHEPGSAFYPFAALTFLGAPLIGGIVARSRAQGHRLKAFFTSSAAVFGIVWALFVFTYVVLPQFDRTSVQLPEFCDGLNGSFNPPAQVAYALPGVGTGILLANDTQTAVVVLIDSSQPP